MVLRLSVREYHDSAGQRRSPMPLVSPRLFSRGSLLELIREISNASNMRCHLRVISLFMELTKNYSTIAGIGLAD